MAYLNYEKDKDYLTNKFRDPVFDESTGYYGELTTEAIRKFQQLRGLPVTGIADHETQRLLLED